MPNWTWNTISCGNPEVIKSLCSTDETGKTIIDFGIAYPMPKEYDELPSDDYKLAAIAYYSTKRLTDKPNVKLKYHGPITVEYEADLVRNRVQDNPDRYDEYMNYEDLYKLGKIYCDVYEKYGCFDWYEWCTENWGTKWNACESNVNEDFMVADFMTAWCEPFPIFNWLCEKFPNEKIDFNSEYEEGDVFEFTNDNGVAVMVNHYERIWDEEKGEYVNE